MVGGGDVFCPKRNNIHVSGPLGRKSFNDTHSTALVFVLDVFKSELTDGVHVVKACKYGYILEGAVHPDVVAAAMEDEVVMKFLEDSRKGRGEPYAEDRPHDRELHLLYSR